MKGALDDLIAEAKSNYAMLEVHLHPRAVEMQELREAEVSESRIDALYPLDMNDYVQPVLDLVTRLEKTSPKIYDAFEKFDLGALLDHLPSDLGDEARESLGDWPSAAGHLRVIVHTCYSLARYDPSLHTLLNESETESENAWADALYYMQETSSLLSKALAAGFHEKPVSRNS